MDDRNKDLSKYRLEKANECLASANILLENRDYCGAANRSYYSIFHCVRALLALEGIDYSKHTGVMSHFRKFYVKTGIFDKEYSRIITDAFSVRSDADYDDYYLISKEEVTEQIKKANFFIDGVTEYITHVINDEVPKQDDKGKEQLETDEKKKSSTGRKL